MKFIRPVTVEGEIRLASLENIAAFKLDAIDHRKEKKDFVDIAVLFEKFSFGQMIELYQEKFPMNDKDIVLSNILDTEGQENSVEPVMLIDLTPDTGIQLIEQKVKEYSQSQINRKAQLEQERLKKIADLPEKRNEQNQNRKGKSL